MLYASLCPNLLSINAELARTGNNIDRSTSRTAEICSVTNINSASCEILN